MTEAQTQLQNALTNTFFTNLAFLSEYDNELYHKVDELSRMIEQGTYIEKYALEFNMKDGDFDIFDIVNNKYLYNNQPKKKTDELVRKVEYNEKNAILNLEEFFLHKDIFDVKAENRFSFETNDTVQYTYNKMKEYTTITKDYFENHKKRLKKIKKFIFLGTLLGRHIPRIAKKVEADLYIVLEKNLEIFRLSLFTVDYTILAQKGVIFSIMDEENKEEEKIDLFLNIYNYDNYLLKFSTTGINIDNYISKILGIMTSKKPMMYDHNRKLYIHLNRTVKRIEEKFNFPQFETISKEFDYFKNIPVLYIAAGPSLDENLEWIKLNQNKFFIVSIGAAYQKLLSNNIRVDIISTVDEGLLLDNLQFNDEAVKKIPAHTIILASSITNDKILNKFNKNRVFIFEIFRKIFQNNIAFNGYSVGEITLHILISLNIKEIYLIGLDLALNQKTGETHSKNSNSNLKTFNLNMIDDRNTFSLDNSTLKVKGNFQEEVVTSGILYNSINFMNQQILKYKPEDVNIYNLSQNGAYFKSTIPTRIEDINIYSFKDIDIKNILIKDNLKVFCKNGLNKNEKLNLSFDIKCIEDFLNIELKEIKDKQFKNFEEFYEYCVERILIELDFTKYKILRVILDKYYLLVIPYLKYYFNEETIKNEDKKVNKIKDIFISQIVDILEDYISIIKKLVN
ncbi:motility accessory factor [Aliarcobacter cibarius]|uniref:motility associated factor glycosyltransferase family protein n=1 Tax=Aliarcobacter cibarius TaxID=255507 RepID=UPI001246BAC1|nr:6-hydroxymethylpterin diphosphokinase MptE-like protein [Aliarcobacter cibarius]QEZ88263.1 motility accessory factor [Aliarcobacter cibarius]